MAVVFMLEQYLDGPEVDVDLVFNQGEVVYGGITDNWCDICAGAPRRQGSIRPGGFR